MLGDTIDIKKDERRYNELLSRGMLPGAAIRKIETEKRLGIGVKSEEDESINVVKIAVIGLGLIVGISIIKKIVSPGISISATSSYSLTVDDIEGIDIGALMVCRQNGLM